MPALPKASLPRPPLVASQEGMPEVPRPGQPCLQSGCPHPASSRGRCDQHARAKARAIDRRRPNSRDRGHTPQWAAFRRRYLAENPWCACTADDCHGTQECTRDAHDLDHLDGTGRTGPNAYEPTNLQGLCKSCHSRKTVRHDGGFGR